MKREEDTYFSIRIILHIERKKVQIPKKWYSQSSTNWIGQHRKRMIITVRVEDDEEYKFVYSLEDSLC